jgi:hypothetical protein
MRLLLWRFADTGIRFARLRDFFLGSRHHFILKFLQVSVGRTSSISREK